MEILLRDFLSKRSFVLVATAQPVGTFFKDNAPQMISQYNSTASNIHHTQGNANKDDSVYPPRGTSFAITGMRRQNGTLFVKCVDRWDILSFKGQYSPQSNLWTPFLQHEFDYNPDQHEIHGEFWITLDELSSLFYSIDVCRIASWDSISIKG